jgi:hypothetical protein
MRLNVKWAGGAMYTVVLLVPVFGMEGLGLRIRISKAP